MRDNISTEKAVALFRFIRDLAKLRNKTIKKTADNGWYAFLSDLPDNDNVLANDNYEDIENSNDVILKVKKPTDKEIPNCPQPPEELLPWLKEDWRNFNKSAALNLEKQIDLSEEDISIEDIEILFNEWNQSREEWANNRKEIEKVLQLFYRLHNLYMDLQRDSETNELVIGNGILEIVDEKVEHPILVKRVSAQFDAEKNTIFIIDTETKPELYTSLLQSIEGFAQEAVTDAEKRLDVEQIHPFDAIEARKFLTDTIHRLSASSVFLDNSNDTSDERYKLFWNPVIFSRKRPDGSVKAIGHILNNIEESGYVPNHILELVGESEQKEPEEYKEQSIDELLARSCGESNEILLTKEANGEQLEIAERINRENAVLVQGPPGTGKTHTIANLLGNFLAEGKSVLITSQTKKALSVLKDKVPKDIQNLCVSMMDDKNDDMVKSIDHITEYISSHNTNDLQKKIAKLEKERLEIIDDLSNLRRSIFAVKHKETEAIVFNGHSYSLIEVGKYVASKKDELSDIIPGEVEYKAPLPLATNDLNELYRLNGEISLDEERILNKWSDKARNFISPEDYSDYIEKTNKLNKRIAWFKESLNMDISVDWDNKNLTTIVNDEETVLLRASTNQNLPSVDSNKQLYSDVPEWVVEAVVDGKNGGNHKGRWLMLSDKIQEVKNYADAIVKSQFGVEIQILEGIEGQNIIENLTIVKDKIKTNGKLPVGFKTLNRNAAVVWESVKINDRNISNPEECQKVIDHVELSQKRFELGKYWDELIGKHGGRVFAELGESPEVECSDIMSQYKWALDWYDECYKPLLSALGEVGVNVAAVSINKNSSTEKERIRNDLYWYSEIAPNILLLCSEFNDVLKSLPRLNKTYDDLQMCETDKQDILFELKKALENEECEKYKDSYSQLNIILHKSDLLDKRNEWLNRIGDVAPEWANAIRLRTGIHGEEICPENIDEAWMWKQFNMIVEKILDEPYDSFQEQLVSKGKRLHEVTAALVAQKAWCNLLIRTNENHGMRRSLQEWKGLQERIGKGTGKRAPKLRKQAREMMAECQNAVPAWIMPMSKALESFDATKNQFDVVIVDEASQSDITAFAIVYLAKKAIIVGDDKQVSPMAIGQEENIIESLQEKYLKGVFSAWKLYDGKTSLYSMAKLTFTPLMLKEHFRCVPEIIGYSNNLSYDGKIKPLRDASESKLLPAIVSYRVDGGVREQPQKINRLEAKTISALIKACIESEEYKEKTFGVISLLGNEQAKAIESEISNHISPVVIEERQILCGNASHFQGDERDVVFLSMVDSNEGEGPLSKKTEGPGESNKQRYNVAVSRARDQLWIVHSLDYKNDLKSEDIRRDLLEYAEDPDSLDRKNRAIEKESESPFEEEVAKRLVADGYNIEQQYRVGAYRIDMVVKSGNKKIALECDGEAFHSTDEQIRNDMERQTILERMGWRFIRVRGIEYYSNPDKAIHRIEAELDDYDIKPERDDSNITSKKETSDLLERVKIRAFELLKEEGLEMTSEEVEPQEDEIVDTQESIDADTDDIHTDKEEMSPKEETVDVLEGQLEMDVEHESPEVEVSGTEENVIIDDKPGTDLFDKLDEYGFGYIDHIDKSGILWIPLTVAQQESKREVLETLLKQRNLQYSYEARGAIATNSKPSYRVMISRKG